MMHFTLVVALFVLLAALLYVRTIRRLLREETELTTETFAKWRHAENNLAVVHAKVNRLLGEKANLEYKNRQLELELRKKHRRTKI